MEIEHKFLVDKENCGGRKYIVRLWDGMDGVWIDISDPVNLPKAQMIFNQHTNNGTKNTNYDDIDYYRIFPADTKMAFSYDGALGPMFRNE